MMDAITVEAASDSLWATLVEQQDSDVFHSPRWMRVLERTYGFDPQALVLIEGRAVTAGVPYCTISDFRGRRVVTLPFSDYCDPLVADTDQWQQLVSVLGSQQLPLRIRVLHNAVPLADPRFEVAKKAKWHGLDLRPSAEMLWEQLPSTAQRAIRKARREDVVVRPASGREELRAFYELHLRVRKYKYRLLAQPYKFFENIWDEFVVDGSGILLTALHHGRLVGGVMLLAHNGTLYYKFSASDVSQTSLRPNDRLIWEGIEYAKSRGYTSLDFGLTDWDQEGLLRYKRKFATDEKTITFLRYGPSPSSSLEVSVGDQLTKLTQLFTDERVPDDVTESAGDVLYSLFA